MGRKVSSTTHGGFRNSRRAGQKASGRRSTALIEVGSMQPPGLAEVERAKRDGRWQAAYASQSRTTVPPDFAKALAANPSAFRFFETLDSRNRYAILFRVHTAKNPETRVKRIEKFIGMLARGEKLHS
jgi:uncharacterized protein YdeI (YjbR/CyaY-like superfamily)